MNYVQWNYAPKNSIQVNLMNNIFYTQRQIKINLMKPYKQWNPIGYIINLYSRKIYKQKVSFQLIFFNAEKIKKFEMGEKSFLIRLVPGSGVKVFLDVSYYS